MTISINEDEPYDPGDPPWIAAYSDSSETSRMFRYAISEHGLVLLQLTTQITDSHRADPYWQIVDRVYINNGLSVERAAASIVNAIFTQKRGVFCLSERSLNALMKGDRNRPRKIRKGLRHGSWASVVEFLVTSGFISVVVPSVGKGASIFEVIDPVVLNLLCVDLSAQREECLAFQAKRSTQRPY